LCFNAACSRRRALDPKARGFEVPFKIEGRVAFIKRSRSDTAAAIGVEIADDEEQRARGLMWRYAMPDSNGMLFVFDQEEPVSFWMRNTYLPLDIVFVNRAKEIVAIRSNTTPLSDDLLPSNQPVRYVVEVNAWFCASHGIEVGDRIAYRIID
jgi:hypothetical protein